MIFIKFRDEIIYDLIYLNNKHINPYFFLIYLKILNSIYFDIRIKSNTKNKIFENHILSK